MNTTAATPPPKAKTAAAGDLKFSSKVTQEQCKRIFGEAHPEDVLAPLKMAIETIYWLESLLEAIKECPSISSHIKNLAGMGRYLASDIGNIADVALEKMTDAVNKEKDA